MMSADPERVLYLTEDDVAATLDVATTIDLLDHACRALVTGEAMFAPRTRMRSGPTRLNVLPASLGGRLGHKCYTGALRPRGARFWFTLYAASGEMLAIVEADTLGRIRTGAASGLATRILARPDATVAALIGTGRQAGTQLEAVCRARPIERVRVWGRNAEHAAQFCARMRDVVEADLEPVADAATAVRGAHVVSVITKSSVPVLAGATLSPGAHVNAAGSNRAADQEIDAEAVRRAAVVAVDDVAQAKIESGDLIVAQREGAFDWERAVRLAEIVAGTADGRRDEAAITLFESLGIGLWDIAAANHVYDACVATGRGRELDLPT
jgi:alanine dehydrogenase